MRAKYWILAVALAVAALPALAAEATFERNFNINGQLDLSVSNGSGNVHLVRSSGNQIHIYGRVRSGWGGSEDRVRQIAEHPPVEQTGNIVRIGAHHGSYNNVSIDYEIQAPANARLELSCGSGNINDEGVGVNARLETGSGNIVAKGVQGGFSVEAGSGNIYVEQFGEGQVRAEAGSGTLELHNIRGGMKAETGSGTIRISGTPTAAWRIEAGSGTVEVALGNNPATLDLEAGSGSIRVNRAFSQQTSSERHHVAGQLNGGGPLVHIETGSGSIRIN